MTDTSGARAELFDVGLRLLDRQLVGSKDELLGNVDNALLEAVDGDLAVTALVSGPEGLGPRFGGRLEGWMVAVWRRLRPEGDPAPVVIPMNHVVELGSAVVLDDHAQRLVTDGAQLERWLRYYVVERIPGATGGPDRLVGEPIGSAHPGSARPAEAVPRGGHLMSDLLGARVRDAGGADLGIVLDLCTEAPHAGRHRVGALPLRAVLYGRRRLGADMGYATQRDQGPWIVAAPLRAWHRADRVVLFDHVRIDWEGRIVEVTRTGRARHPYE
jgi:hypothetical protein